MMNKGLTAFFITFSILIIHFVVTNKMNYGKEVSVIKACFCWMIMINTTIFMLKVI